jgi:transposase InsO family protein
MVGTDVFYRDKKPYLLVVDYYSRYPEIALMSGETSKELIKHLKSIFARHGIPEMVISDNGPAYASDEFRAFAKSYQFQHVTSSPRYPRGNGAAERMVKTVKAILDKSEDPYLGLLAYRATPLQTGLSPAELLMNRQLRTTLMQLEKPILTSEDHEQFKKANHTYKVKMKDNHDSHKAKSLQKLKPGSQVYIRDLQRYGVILNEEPGRSYTVDTDPVILRRNRSALTPTSDKQPERSTEPTVAETPPIIQDTIPIQQPEPVKNYSLRDRAKISCPSRFKD